LPSAQVTVKGAGVEADVHEADEAASVVPHDVVAVKEIALMALFEALENTAL
jgi:hypothetical protein